MSDERRRMAEVYALVREGRMGEALDRAEAALDVYPGSLGLRALRTDILLKSGDVHKAGKEIRRLLAERPEHPRILSLGGDLSRLEERYEDAAQLYKRSLELRDDDYVRNRAVDMLLRLKRFDEAESLLSTGLRKKPRDPWLLRRKARLLAARGDKHKAAEILEHTADNTPASFYDYAQALRLKLDALSAEDRFKEVARLIKVPTHRANPWLFALLAELALDVGREESAKDYLDKAKSLEPKDPHLQKKLGFLYNRLQCWTNVLETLGQAFIAEPRDVVTQQVLFAAAKKADALPKLKTILLLAYEAHPGFHKLKGLIRKAEKLTPASKGNAQP